MPTSSSPVATQSEVRRSSPRSTLPAGRPSSSLRIWAVGAEEVFRLVAAAGPVDVLVNNAGLWSTPLPTADISEAVLLESYRTNVLAPFLLTGALAPTMAARGGGAVVNIGSITGFIGSDRSALYNSTKAAVHSLTKSWAAEYGPSGVRVNAVAPGPIATERAGGGGSCGAGAGPDPVTADEHTRGGCVRGGLPGLR